MIANCPYCRNEFYVPVDLGGRTVNCAKCKKPVHAPALRPEELELDLPKLLVGEEGSQKCLEQIKAMRVFAAVDSVAEKLGLTAKKIRSDVELQLQKWGITLLSERQLIKNPRMPILAVSVQALEGPQECVAEIANMYRERRDVLCDGLHSLGWPVDVPRATMFVWAKIPEPYQAMGSLEFSKKLLSDAKVAVSPGIGFGEYGDDYVRFGLIENPHRTRQAIRCIRDMFNRDLGQAKVSGG